MNAIRAHNDSIAEFEYELRHGNGGHPQPTAAPDWFARHERYTVLAVWDMAVGYWESNHSAPDAWTRKRLTECSLASPLAVAHGGAA